jgi:hypothetical protein
MLTRSANSEGAIFGVAAGILGLVAAFYFEVSEFWFGALTCVPTLVTGFLGSQLFDSPSEVQTRGLVIGVPTEN